MSCEKQENWATLSKHFDQIRIWGLNTTLSADWNSQGLAHEIVGDEGAMTWEMLPPEDIFHTRHLLFDRLYFTPFQIKGRLTQISGMSMSGKHIHHVYSHLYFRKMFSI